MRDKIILFLLLMMPLSSFGDVKISQLPLASPGQIVTADSFPYVDSTFDVTRRLKLSDLLTTSFFVSAFGAKQNLLPLTTKGDILTRSSSAYIRFAACSDGQQMQADSTQSSGWKCVSPNGSIETHGTVGAPITITAGGGIIPTNATYQVWWVQSAGGSVNITANPPISVSNCTTQGMILVLKGVSASNYINIYPISGVDQNGPIGLDNNNAIEYMCDASVPQWSENFRRK